MSLMRTIVGSSSCIWLLLMQIVILVHRSKAILWYILSLLTMVKMLCWGSMMLHMLCSRFVMMMLLSCRSCAVPSLRGGLFITRSSSRCLWMWGHTVWKSALCCTLSTRYSNISLVTLDHNNCTVKLCSGLTVSSRYTSIRFVRLMMNSWFHSMCLLSCRISTSKSTACIILIPSCTTTVSEKYLRLALISV